MANSTIQQVPTAFTDTSLPILYRDPLINAGSLYLFDFTSAYCNPNPDGNLSAGAVFNNLVDGGAAASILSGATAGGFANLTGKAGLSLSGGNNATLDLGAQYDFSTSLHPFVAIIWIKTPTTGFTTGYPKVLSADGYASAENIEQFSFDMASDGKQPRVGCGNGTTSQALSIPDGQGLGAVSQIAMSWSPGVLSVFYNGALYNSTTTSVPATLAAPTVNVQSRNAYNGRFYQTYLEDLQVSGLTAASVVAADYAIRSAHFV